MNEARSRPRQLANVLFPKRHSLLNFNCKSRPSKKMCIVTDVAPKTLLFFARNVETGRSPRWNAKRAIQRPLLYPFYRHHCNELPPALVEIEANFYAR